MEDAHIRLECLKFAMQLADTYGGTAQAIIDNSEKFYAFAVAKRLNASPEEA